MGKEATPKVVAYLKSWVVGKEKHSKHLVSHDVHNSTYNFKKAYYIELCPLSRGDLVFLPRKIAKALACPQILLVLRVRSNLHLVDPKTGRYYEVSREEYWRNPFQACSTAKQLREFVVMDDSNFPEVTVAQASELGAVDDCLVETRAHFQMEVSDEVLGYDLVNCVISALDDINEDDLPTVILVERKKGKTVLVSRHGEPLRPPKGLGTGTEEREPRGDGDGGADSGVQEDPNVSLDDAEIPEEDVVDLVNIITAPEENAQDVPDSDTSPIRDNKDIDKETQVRMGLGY